MSRVDLSLSLSRQAYETLPRERMIEEAELELEQLQQPVMRKVHREEYFLPQPLLDAVNLALALGRPLLLQGEPGCGKTRLAYAVAYGLGLPLEVAPVKSTSRAQDLLYTYDAVRRLYDAQLGADERSATSIAVRNYIRLGPLGRAIARATFGRRSVVLIDEIDKADLDFPNDLLWELDRLQFTVTEAPELKFNAGDALALRPFVIVTHNEEKALPTAFLRRCIFYHIPFPSTPEELWNILQLHAISDEALGKRAIELLFELRALDLSKRPGLSELLDWVGYLEAVRTPVAELDRLPGLGALLKQYSDQQRALQQIAAE